MCRSEALLYRSDVWQRLNRIFFHIYSSRFCLLILLFGTERRWRQQNTMKAKEMQRKLNKNTINFFDKMKSLRKSSVWFGWISYFGEYHWKWGWFWLKMMRIRCFEQVFYILIIEYQNGTTNQLDTSNITYKLDQIIWLCYDAIISYDFNEFFNWIGKVE